MGGTGGKKSDDLIRKEAISWRYLANAINDAATEHDVALLKK